MYKYKYNHIYKYYWLVCALLNYEINITRFTL